MTWAGAGMVLAGIALVGAAVSALPALWRFIKATAKIPGTLEAVWSEFDSNGGSTMRASVDRSAATVEANAAAMARLEEGHGAILEWESSHTEQEEGRFDSIDGRLVKIEDHLASTPPPTPDGRGVVPS